MAIQKITYDNKVAINVDSTIPDINKCNASDLNQIKSVVNNNADETPTKVSDLTNDAGYITKDVNDLTNYTLTSNLSEVATSGSYNDLTDKPTIPSISDEYGTSTTNGYSQNYINSNTLNSTGDATTTQSNVSSATITNTLNAPLEIVPKGNTSQTGTPTPDASVSVNVVSGDNTITISDGDSDTSAYNINLPVENLFDKDNPNTLNAIIRSNGSIQADTTGKCIYIQCKPSTKYSVSKVLSNDFRFGTTSSLPTTGMTVSDLFNNSGATSGTITTNSSAKYLVLFYYYNDTLTEQQIRDTIQIEQGSKANTYTPYGTTPIELCKIPNTNYEDRIFHAKDGDTYYDSLDSVTKQTLTYGKWYLHKEVGKYTYNNDLGENGIVGDTVELITPTLNITPNISDDGLYGITYCNLLQGKRINGTGLQGTTAVSKIRIALKGYATTYNEARAVLSNLIIYYQLATATNTEITYTSLINQLDALEEAQSYEGTTNINQVNNDLPFILDITAFLDTYDGRYEGLKQGIENNKNNINELEYAFNESKPVVLYDNPSGTLSNAVLNEAPTNYNYLEIFFKDDQNFEGSLKIASGSHPFILSMVKGSSVETAIFLNTNRYNINGSTITYERTCVFKLATSGILLNTTSSVLRITKVLGYK